MHLVPIVSPADEADKMRDLVTVWALNNNLNLHKRCIYMQKKMFSTIFVATPWYYNIKDKHKLHNVDSKKQVISYYSYRAWHVANIDDTISTGKFLNTT